MTPRCQPSPADHDDRARSHLEIGLDQLARLRDDVGFFLLTPEILRVELLGQLARLVGHGVVGCQQESRGDVRRAHSTCGVHARSEHETDVIAVDFLAGETAHLEQRTQTDLVRSLGKHAETELGDHAVLASQRDDVRQRPDGCHFHERGHPVISADRAHSACTSLSATPTPARFFSGYEQSWRLGLMTASASGSSRVRLVMVGDDEIQPQRSRVGGCLYTADAAVHRDDEANIFRGKSIERCAAAARSRHAGVPG